MKLHEAKALKEQVNATQRKEAVLKDRLGPWKDDAYVLTTSIEEKFSSLQTTHHKIWVDSAGPMMEKLVKEAMQCIVKVRVVHVELGVLHEKIFAPTE